MFVSVLAQFYPDIIITHSRAAAASGARGQKQWVYPGADRRHEKFTKKKKRRTCVPVRTAAVHVAVRQTGKTSLTSRVATLSTKYNTTIALDYSCCYSCVNSSDLLYCTRRFFLLARRCPTEEARRRTRGVPLRVHVGQFCNVVRAHSQSIVAARYFVVHQQGSWSSSHHRTARYSPAQQKTCLARSPSVFAVAL